MFLRISVFLIMTFMVAPILIMIPLSFSSEVAFHFPPSGYSLQWYQNLWNDNQWMEGLMLSLIVAVSTAILSTVLGIMASLAVRKLEFPGKKIFMNLMVAPMVIPVIVAGIAMYHSFAQFKINNTIVGLTLSHSILAIPIVFVTVLAGLKGMDPNLELAAQSLGSTPIGTFFKVTLPLIRSSVISAGLFAFITSLDEVVVTIFISGSYTKTLPIVMWENMRTQVDPTIAAVSTVLIVVTTAVFLFSPGLVQTKQVGK
ncbi:MAG TPA: ABC transporter permease [Bacillota bacterium]|nr:ABC transporter permease [Bacillota bacterium]